MAPSARLEEYRTVVREHLLPAYVPLGSLTLAYLLGSLVHGYTDAADLDVMMVWAAPEVPGGPQRAAVVTRLDERQRTPPFVVDYRDIHLDRFVIADQEYNVAHMPLVALHAIIGSVLDARQDGAEQVLNPLGVTAGFCYGEIVLDRDGVGQQLREQLHAFPQAVKQGTRRALLAHRQEYLDNLRTFAARGDWFMFDCTLVDAVRLMLRALFASRGVYYPGDKWLREAIVCFGLGTEVLAWFDDLWPRERDSEATIAALSRLMDRAADQD